MSDTEMIVVLGLLVLIAVGIILMLVPVSSNEEQSGFVLREIEPRVGEENQLIDFRYSMRQPNVASQTDASEDEPGLQEGVAPATTDPEQTRIPDEPPDWPGDELFYLAATEEVDGDQRQPGLWAKVMALNAGDEKRARFHYIRLRVAQIIENQPPPEPQMRAGSLGAVADKASAVAARPGSDEKAVAEMETAAGLEEIADIVVKVEGGTESDKVSESDKAPESDEVPGVEGVAGIEKRPGPEEEENAEAAPGLAHAPEAEASPKVKELFGPEKGPARQKIVEAQKFSSVEEKPRAEAVPRLREVVKAEKSVGAKTNVKAEISVEDDAFASILNRELIRDVVKESRSIGRLIRSANLLRDFSVRKYVTSADLRKAILSKGDKGPQASSFFREYHHRTSVSLGDSLQRFDPGIRRSYLISRQFPHQIQLDFFDEALVITIQPGSPETEFLVLAPGSGLGDPFTARFLASSRITELFMAAASENDNPLSLYIELDLLLERLRIG